MRGWLVIVTALGIALLAASVSLIQQGIAAQSITVQVATPSPAVTNTPAPGTTVPTVTFEQMLAVYREVLESTTRAVDDVHKTANTVLTIVGVVFAALGIVGLGGAWWLSRVADKAENALRQATQATELARASEEKTQDLEKVHQGLVQSLSKAQSELMNLGDDLKHWKKSVERDRAHLKRSLELIQIDEHGMAVFSEDTDRRWKSKSALIEMSHRPDPIIRRRCVRVLGALEEYDEAVARRLEEIAESDSARGVRREAEEALRRLKDRQRVDGDERRTS